MDSTLTLNEMSNLLDDLITDLEVEKIERMKAISLLIQLCASEQSRSDNEVNSLISRLENLKSCVDYELSIAMNEEEASMVAMQSINSETVDNEIGEADE